MTNLECVLGRVKRRSISEVYVKVPVWNIVAIRSWGTPDRVSFCHARIHHCHCTYFQGLETARIFHGMVHSTYREARSSLKESFFQATIGTYTVSRELDGRSHRGEVIVAEKYKHKGSKNLFLELSNAVLKSHVKVL
jgi:hypothetical protein